jgi:PDZ domain-containing secreted protein
MSSYKINKSSIGYYQGKLKHGDQTIKIDNDKVRNREQAIEIIKKNLRIIL